MAGVLENIAIEQLQGIATDHTYAIFNFRRHNGNCGLKNLKEKECRKLHLHGGVVAEKYQICVSRICTLT